MARLRYNGLATGASGSTVGLSLGASLTSSATSVTFNAALTHSNGTAVPTIAGSDYIPLEILDANGRLSEIVYLTAYTAGATTGTIGRGKEGTTGVAHSSGDKIAHGAAVQDVPGGFTQLRKSANQTPGNNLWTMITWDVEDYDTLNLHDNVTNNTRLTIPTGGDGIYTITYNVSIPTGLTDTYLQFSVNGTQVPGRVGPFNHSSNMALGLSRQFALVAGDYVEAGIYTNAQPLKGGTDSCILTATRIAAL